MNIFKNLILLFSLILLSITVSCSEKNDIRYPSASDLPTKYKEVLTDALSGSDTAQVDIAFAYIDGDGVQINNKRAIPWLRIAANKNNNEAEKTLSAIYFNAAREEHGQDKYKIAFQWNLLQAKKGNKRAQYIIASLYEDGLGIKKDLNKAFEWYLKSAKNGHIKSQRNIGSAYLVGTTVKKDENKSFIWFKRAAENGEEDSMFFIGRYYRDGIVTAKNLVKSYQWMKLSLFLAVQSGSDNDIVDKRKSEFNTLKSIMTSNDIKQAEIWYKRKTS